MTWSRLITLCLLLVAGAVSAQQVYVHVENDILAGSDGHYTGGIELGWRSEAFELAGRPATPVWQVKLLVFTPQDVLRPVPDPADLPYAGVALLHWNLFLPRRGRNLIHFGVQVGWMGPSTHLGELQRSFHRAIGNHVPTGWDQQMPDQPVAGTFANYAVKVWERADRRVSVQLNGGGMAGNFARYVNAALLLRWGVDAHRVRAFDQILGASASEALWRGRDGWQLDVGVQVNRFFYLALVNDRHLPLRETLSKFLIQLQYSWRHWQVAFLAQRSDAVLASQSRPDSWGGLKLAYAFE